MPEISPDNLRELHAALLPIIRSVLQGAGLSDSGWVLDLASGPGTKLPLLAEACGPAVGLLALDQDYGAIMAVASGASGVVGDALALPVRDGCLAGVCCIAALGLFADQLAALREMRRVLQPGGRVLIVTGEYMWARVTHWPSDLVEHLASAYTQALATGQPRPGLPDIGDELAEQLSEAGFAGVHIRAFALDGHDPLESELLLLPWAVLRPLVLDNLDPQSLERCEAVETEIELCALALVASSHSPR